MSVYVYDSNTKEAITDAEIMLPALNKSTTFQERGNFQINTYTDFDSVTAMVVSEGYYIEKIVVAGQGPVVKIVELRPFEGETKEVEIISKRREYGVANIQSNEIKKLPSFLGEPDILKTLEYKAGFLNIGENSVGLSVRGGEPSQNLMLLGDAPVFNVSHLFGFMSNINSDAVTGLQAYKGGFPAERGGRISSVVQLEMRQGDPKKTHVNGGIGVLATRISVDGPIIKDKLTYLIAGRRTYLDAFVPYLNSRKTESERIKEPIPNYHFIDGNAHIQWKLSNKDQITATAFGAGDQFSYDNLDFDLDFRWQNRMADLEWRHFIDNTTFIKNSVSYSSYSFNLFNEVPDFFIQFSSGIEAFRYDGKYEKAFDNGNTLTLGVAAEQYFSSIAALDAGGVTSTTTSSPTNIDVSAGEERDAFIANSFGTYTYQINPRTNAQFGLRLSGFYGDDTYYGNIEPRVQIRHFVHKNLALFASYDRMAQYVHQLYGAGFSLPVDIWYPSTENLKPQRSHQLAVGATYAFGKDFSLNYEVYYKAMDNQPELLDGALLVGTGALDEQTVLGFGNAFAACELEIEKKKGNTQGWVSYTLARTTRFGYDDINNGEAFSPRQDVRHNLSVAVIHDLNKKWSLSSTFAYRSGLFSWLPRQRIQLQNTGSGEPATIVPVYENRNNVRLPAYLRLDLGVIWNFTKKQNITLSITNVTNRRNPFFFYLTPEYQDVEVNDTVLRVPTQIKAQQVTLFPILPTLSWNFKF